MKIVIIQLCKILSMINKIIIKRSNRIVLYSNLGFRDNIEALYSYLINNNYNIDYKIIVSSNDFKKIDKIKGVKYVGCIKGVLYFLTSKYFFYCFGKYPINPSDKQVVVNLWHGMPLKKIGNLEKGKEKNKYDYFTNLISTSNYFDNIMAKSFGCNKNKLLHVGQPRTDYFFNFDSKIDLFKKYLKIFIWMPTFRTTEVLKESNTSDLNNVLPLIHNSKDLNKLNDFLKESNSLLLIKLHPIQSKKNFMFNNKSNIMFIDEEYLQKNNLNVYKLLVSTDCLITDYSSVYFDYLMLNRPIIFTVEDIEDYKANRGLNFENLEEIMPGDKISNLKMMLDSMKKVINMQDEYSNQRIEINHLLNEYSTTNNCLNICNSCNIKRRKKHD